MTSPLRSPSTPQTKRRMSRNFVAWSLGALGSGFLAIQLVPVARENPQVSREVRWDSEMTRDVAVRSCYDCHSNETRWPWYSRVAPVSWLVAKDVREGREHLNFSTWEQPNEGAAEILEVVEDGEMPLRKYTLLHPDARLRDATLVDFLRGLRTTLEGDPPIEEGQSDEDEHAH